MAAERETPLYASWVRAEGLEVVDGSCLADLRAVELKPWARRGGRGVFVHHDATPVSSDCYVCEIPSGGSLAPQHQRYEEIIFVLDGRGSTSVSNDAGESRTFEWKAGMLFAVPLNATHRHFNGSGRQSARFVAVTTAPAIINAVHDLDFGFGTRRDFEDRLNAEPEDSASPAAPQALRLGTACVLDAVDCPLMPAAERGAGGHVSFRIGNGSLSIQISQLPPATYGKAHAEGPGAHIIILAGEGYSLVWPEGGRCATRHWREGALIVPPNAWWRQHFNPGRSPARYLTIEPEAAVMRNAQGVPKAGVSRALGDARIDYADEAPEIRVSFAAALAESGLESRMPEAYAAETA